MAKKRKLPVKKSAPSPRGKVAPKIVHVVLPPVGVVRVVAPPGVLPVIAPSKPGVVEIVPVKRPRERKWWDIFGAD